MSDWTCPLPPMSEHYELKEAFEHKIYPPTLKGWGYYFMGLSALEEIDDLNECLIGNTMLYQSALESAQCCFRTAKEHLRQALDICLEFRGALPEVSRKMLSPNIEIFYSLIMRIKSRTRAET